MLLKFLIFVLCSFALLGEIAAIGSMGPLGHLDIHSVYECSEPDIPEGDEIKIKAELVKINDQGDKALTVLIENKIPIDDNLNLVIDIKKFEFGNWYPFYSIKGKPCHELLLYIKKLWTKTVTALEPKPNGTCPIPAGTYKFDKLQYATNDFDLKSIFYGKLMVKVTLKDKSGKLLYCVTGDGESQSIL